MRTCPLLALVLLCTLSLAGCAATPAVTAKPAAQSNATPQTVADLTTMPHPVIGFWFHGLFPHDDRSERDDALVGLFMEPAANSESLAEVLARAPIVATFRSAREGYAAAEQLRTTHDREVAWCRAEYAGHWMFSAQRLPTKEPNPIGATEAIGEIDDTPEHCHELLVLPPPLQQRGVALAVRGHGKAFALLALYPRDLSTYVYRSWDEMQKRPPGRLADECGLDEAPAYIGAGFRMYFLDGYGPSGPLEHRILWKDRERLRQNQDGPSR